MSTLLAALAGGAIGVLLTWLARLTVIGREIAEHDRALAALDEDLESWVADETVKLRRELQRISNSMVADPETREERNLLWSGEHGYQVSLAKEHALEAYRNEERRTKRAAAELRAQENWAHTLARRRRGRQRAFELQAPGRARPLLDRWAAPVTRHSSSKTDRPLLIDDPRNRTIESTLAELDLDPKALV